MTVYYCGPGGNDANSGLTWALRKLTLNGCENVPITAGSTVYVGPGTYRELLTCDVSGTAGNPITYIGDYLGTNTDGVGGLVRITGSDDDKAVTRTNCITGVARHYRTFTGFCMDMCSAALLNSASASTNWIVNNCYFGQSAGNGIANSSVGATWSISRCMFAMGGKYDNAGIYINNATAVDTQAQAISNCLFLAYTGVQVSRVGGVTITNSAFIMPSRGVCITAALTVGQTVVPTNCIFMGATYRAVEATTVAEMPEDFNTFYQNATDRTNVNVGANSVTYPPLFDPRWFMQLVHAGAGPSSVTQLLTPFDLASFSALINLAGTSPSTTDMRGTAVQGAQREWGALEYDSTLKIAGSGGGGPLVGGGLVGD